MVLMGAVIAAYVYFISLYMQRVLGASALFTGLALLPSTVTIVLMSTFATRRLLDRLGVKRMLLIGLASMGVGQVWLSLLTRGGSYLLNVLPGLLLTSVGIAQALPAASIGATTGGDRSQQVGSAVGLDLLAPIAAACTEQTASLAAGYGFSYLVATGIVLLAMVLVATQLNHQACQPNSLVNVRRQLQAGYQPCRKRIEGALPRDQKKEGQNR
jgi:MFS family permease